MPDLNNRVVGLCSDSGALVAQEGTVCLGTLRKKRIKVSSLFGEEGGCLQVAKAS